MIIFGKWFVALRVGDFYVGIGRPSNDLRSQVVRDRAHLGI